MKLKQDKLFFILAEISWFIAWRYITVGFGYLFIPSHRGVCDKEFIHTLLIVSARPE